MKMRKISSKYENNYDVQKYKERRSHSICGCCVVIVVVLVVLRKCFNQNLIGLN